jgi:hypothetical protein
MRWQEGLMPLPLAVRSLYNRVTREVPNRSYFAACKRRKCKSLSSKQVVPRSGRTNDMRGPREVPGGPLASANSRSRRLRR